MQQRNQRKGNTKAEGMEQNFVIGKKAAGQVFNQAGNRRFANPAQSEGSQRNAELNGAEISIQTLGDF